MKPVDRVLLERAAKAIGCKFRLSREWHEVDEPQIWVDRGRGSDWRYWNPLEDDEHAMQLITSLEVSIVWDRDSVEVHQIEAGYVTESFKPDIYEKQSALRRAIVRAASDAQVFKEPT